MKKFVVFALCFLLTGCSFFHKDIDHATAEVVSSSGKVQVFNSFNDIGKNYSVSGKTFAIKNTVLVNDDAVTVHFFCEACGHDETVTLEKPSAKLFECDCPELRNLPKDANGNYREYFAIVVGDTTVLEEATKEVTD